jgi:hypothetical protein
MEDLGNALACNNVHIAVPTADIFKKIKFAKNETEIQLVPIFVRDLGFEQGATREEILVRATKSYGLDLVPAEVGPQLRLQYTNQPMNEWLPLAMEHLARSDGRLLAFAIARYEAGRARQILRKSWCFMVSLRTGSRSRAAIKRASDLNLSRICCMGGRRWKPYRPFVQDDWRITSGIGHALT